MVELMHGDILNADAEALVNTVNCVGIMGRGIALQFQKAFPENFKAYKSLCDKKELRPGRMFIYDLQRFENPRYVINFPTKRHWKGKSRLEDITAGLKALVTEVRNRQIHSIAIPPLGCGLGGLKWTDVKPLIEKAFSELSDVEVMIFEPAGAPAPAAMVRSERVPDMTRGRAALLCLIRSYLAAAMDPFITLLEIHKLMYFMQEAGEPLRLRYQKGTYGPYAENLRHVLSAIEGHFITGYGDAADNPDKQIALIGDSAIRAQRYLANNESTEACFGRVSELIQGFETPFGMELLATIHWVVTRERATDLDDAVAKTYAWGERKQMFHREHVGAAYTALQSHNWLSCGR